MCFFVFVLFLLVRLQLIFFFFFFNDTATTEIYTLSLHDALPISDARVFVGAGRSGLCPEDVEDPGREVHRSEEHTSELQSLAYLVCRLLLEKKKYKQGITAIAATQVTRIRTDRCEIVVLTLVQ